MAVVEVPGVQIAGRDAPTEFSQVPAFLTSLAASGLQDRRVDAADPEALAEFPRRLLRIADAFRAIPDSGRVSEIADVDLMSWLPPRRPDEAQVAAWRREMLENKPLPGDVQRGRTHPPMHVPAPNGRPPARLADVQHFHDDDPWLATLLDPSWPIPAQVPLPDATPPLMRSGRMTPFLFEIANRLEHAADVITSRTGIYAACKTVIMSVGTPHAPSPSTRTLATKARGLAAEQVGVWSHAAAYLAASLHSGLVTAGPVLCAQVSTSPSARLAPTYGRD